MLPLESIIQIVSVRILISTIPVIVPLSLSTGNIVYKIIIYICIYRHSFIKFGYYISSFVVYIFLS